MPEAFDPYEALLRERIVVLGGPLDDAAATGAVARLLILQRDSDQRPVSLYVNSAGGPFEAFTALHDTLRGLRPEVETVCFGRADGTAALLVAAGTPGRRLVTPGAALLLALPDWRGELRGNANQLELQSARLEHDRRRTAELLAEYTGRESARLLTDLERPLPLDAAAAVDFGLVDRVVARPRPVPAPRAL